VPRAAGQADVTQRPENSASGGADPSPSPVRTYLLNCGSSALADRAFGALMLVCALSIFAIVLLILIELISGSRLSIQKFGMSFFFGSAWDPVNGNFGALPFIYGTVVSSILALIIAVPLAVGVAIFLTEMCPDWLRGFLAFFTELLAAIPSVVYGLWAVFVLIPMLRQYVNPALIKTLGWTGIFAPPNYGIGMFAAGVILSIMILPIISSLTREVMSAVPHAQREAVLALGATRWEMIRMGVLRNARIGIVPMVIGNRPEITRSLLAPAYSMASVIANEFTEASDELYLSALIEIGLALFIVTIIVNALARVLVWAVTRGAPVRGT
jgi:phosphate transport system permease protein